MVFNKFVTKAKYELVVYTNEGVPGEEILKVINKIPHITHGDLSYFEDYECFDPDGESVGLSDLH